VHTALPAQGRKGSTIEESIHVNTLHHLKTPAVAGEEEQITLLLLTMTSENRKRARFQANLLFRARYFR